MGALEVVLGICIYWGVRAGATAWTVGSSQRRLPGFIGLCSLARGAWSRQVPGASGRNF